jgi:hypothetical protein
VFISVLILLINQFFIFLLISSHCPKINKYSINETICLHKNKIKFTALKTSFDSIEICIKLFKWLIAENVKFICKINKTIINKLLLNQYLLTN